MSICRMVFIFLSSSFSRGVVEARFRVEVRLISIILVFKSQGAGKSAAEMVNSGGMALNTLNEGRHEQGVRLLILIAILGQGVVYYKSQNMSSLAAARADGYYRPKNFDPAKVVPRKSDLAQEKPFVVVQGQRVGGSKVRYETPFHVRCEGCQNMVAKGVRFNSIKTWVGNFHTTKIYEFRMKCPQCPQRFVVRTDPENCDYLYVSGARRIFQTKDCTDESRIRDEEKLRKIKENPFSKLENEYEDKVAYVGMEATIEQLEEQQERGLQDFELNRMLRKQAKLMRQDEKAYFDEKREKNMLVPLLPASIEDALAADQVQFKQDKTKHIKKEDRVMSQRDKLKEKMRKMNPAFRHQLRQEIKKMNKPSTAVYLKK